MAGYWVLYLPWQAHHKYCELFHPFKNRVASLDSRIQNMVWNLSTTMLHFTQRWHVVNRLLDLQLRGMEAPAWRRVSSNSPLYPREERRTRVSCFVIACCFSTGRGWNPLGIKQGQTYSLPQLRRTLRPLLEHSSQRPGTELCLQSRICRNAGKWVTVVLTGNCWVLVRRFYANITDCKSVAHMRLFRTRRDCLCSWGTFYNLSHLQIFKLQ